MENELKGKFELYIYFGNEAMSNRTDLAEALRDVAEQLEIDGNIAGSRIKDLNGNKVGRWQISR